MKKLMLILILLSIVFISGCSNKLQDNQKYKILTDEDIINKIEGNRGRSCYNDRDEYPKIIGKHSENGLNLEEICFCSDYCPSELWHVVIRYENISSKEECVEIGGRDRIDAAWGGYIGCAPNLE